MSGDDAIRLSSADTISREVRAFRELGLVLDPTMSLDEILTEIVDRTARLVGAERSTLFLLEPDDTLVSRVIEGESLAEIHLSLGQGIAGWTGRFGRPLIIEDAYQDERFDPSWDKQTGFVTRSVICHPIFGRRQEIIGVIQALNKIDGGKFSDEDHHLLGAITGQLMLIIESSKLMIDLVQKNRALVEARQMLDARNREIAMLLEFEQRVASSEDLDSLFSAVLTKILSSAGAEACLLYRTDDTGAEIRVAINESPIARAIRVPEGAGFAGWIATKRQEINLVHPSADPRFVPEQQKRIGIPLRSLAGVPITIEPRSDSVGALLLQNKISSDRFDDADMQLLRLVSERLTQAIILFSEREVRERDRRLATVGRLLAGVLHDIKSPMAVISGYAELLAEKTGDPEGEEYLNHLNQAVSRISKMAEDIIAFSRGERDLLTTRVMLVPFLTDFFKQIGPLMIKNNIELKTQVRTAGTIQIDKEKVERVFHNIALNAVESMSPGGVLTVEVDRLEDEIVFAFTDTGRGIPDEIRGSIFQSFVTMGKRQGTGLGLAVAKEIVEAHNGSISFNTTLNRGTTFLVSLPG